MIEYVRVDSNKFAIYHAIYADSNIFASFDWNEKVSYSKPNGDEYFVYRDKTIIGGFAQKDNMLSHPFVVPPFCDRNEYWQCVLQHALETSRTNEINLTEIPEVDTQALTQSFGAVSKWSKHIMLRPTEQFDSMLRENFYFSCLVEKDIPEIVEVIFQAHSTGYTSTKWEPDTAKIKEAVERRFCLFGESNTLFMGNMVKCKTNEEIAGVCIAGVYPDSPNNFATIHQLSVKSEYRRKGIAKAMIQKSINDANSISPVITLGVLLGNPAEILYRETGFVPGPSYSELAYTRK